MMASNLRGWRQIQGELLIILVLQIIVVDSQYAFSPYHFEAIGYFRRSRNAVCNTSRGIMNIVLERLTIVNV
jgi:hypothetical protein